LPIAVACVGILLPAASASAEIVVTVQPPTRVQVWFDLREPPSQVLVAAEGSAACSNVFEIEATIASSVEVVSPTVVRVYPESFDIVTRLKTTLYLPDGSPPKLVVHEEGHRTIGERYYGYAESAARQAASSLVGRSFEAIGADRAAAEQAAGAQVLAALKDAFMQRTHARSAAANARYDEITGHGLHSIQAAVAIELALADDPPLHPRSAQ
jgi:hypothetical protein